MNPFSLNKLPSDILKDISEKYKILRKENKLSQAKLAEQSGVSLGSIKRFENSGQISFESLLKLANAINRLDDFENLFIQKPDTQLEKLFSNKTRRK